MLEKDMIGICQFASFILVQAACNTVGCFIIHLLFIGRSVAKIEEWVSIVVQTFVCVSSERCVFAKCRSCWPFYRRRRLWQIHGST